MNIFPSEKSYLLQAGLLLTIKPEGISTHSPGDGRGGFVEQLTAKTSLPLKVCHRLDRETSGAIIFGVTDDATRKLCMLFEERRVQKEYVFVTDRLLPPQIEFTHRSHIKKRRGRFVSWPEHDDLNSETTFQRLKVKGKYSLWTAIPLTGKPHQIRLHARDNGLNILGDSSHAGSKYHRLMLHAASINFPWEDTTLQHSAPLPQDFLDLVP